MNQQFRRRQLPAGNPFASALVVIVGILVISLSLALGVVVFVGIAGFVLVMAAIMSVRGWWLARGFGRSRQKNAARGPEDPQDPPQIIEGEFHEVNSRRDSEEKPGS